MFCMSIDRCTASVIGSTRVTTAMAPEFPFGWSDFRCGANGRGSTPTKLQLKTSPSTEVNDEAFELSLFRGFLLSKVTCSEPPTPKRPVRSACCCPWFDLKVQRAAVPLFPEPPA
jgi:hypothetical protein